MRRFLVRPDLLASPLPTERLLRPARCSLACWQYSSLNGLAALPMFVADELSASAAKFERVRVRGETSPSADRCQAQQQQRQTPFKGVQVNLSFFPPWNDSVWYCVRPVAWEARTIPCLTNRTVIAICIRIGLREVVLGGLGRNIPYDDSRETSNYLRIKMGCRPTPYSPKMKGFGKVLYRWLIPTS